MQRTKHTAPVLGFACLVGLGTLQPANAAEGNLIPLTSVTTPRPDLTGIVVDNDDLIALGKALFWDVQVGSDGVACASCHYAAGADIRVNNQVHPGNDALFDSLLGPNETLIDSDFPLHLLTDPDDRNSAILRSTDDRVSSQGAFGALFLDLEAPVGEPTGSARGGGGTTGTADICELDPTGPFSDAGTVYRQVAGRNAPTVINAVYNYRNFWDGRANATFNGVDPFGSQTYAADPSAGVLIIERAATKGKASTWTTVLTQLELPHSSLASQALGPPLSSVEMSCMGRSFADVGRDVLPLTALATQQVAIDDSVFGGRARMVNRNGVGLQYSYNALIRRAFHRDFWEDTAKYVIAADGTLTASSAGYTQMEHNFPFFFGLAIQAYEETLVSDQTRFDTGALTAAELRGQDVFVNVGQCADCHTGPLFTSAADFVAAPETLIPEPPEEDRLRVERMLMGDGLPAAYDIGFYNIGVRPTSEDIGLGASDPYGNPLSFAEQFFATNNRINKDGAFKTPTLRNVGLTAPYFHNGGQATLRQVIEFYDRGGDRRGEFATGDTSGYGANLSNLSPRINPIGLTEQQIDDLEAFLLALTDDRVACQAAPFDHPELPLTNGHTGNDLDGDGSFDDNWVSLPAVGSGGLTAEGLPCFANTGDLFGETQNTLNTILLPQ